MDPAEVLSSTSGKANFYRFARLLISGGTSLLREIFDAHCPPSQLAKILSAPATKTLLKGARLTKPQWDHLYPSPGVYGNSTDFDITLLTRLLRTICNITPPSAGWDTPPSNTDHKLAADLVRIRLIRNSVYGHVNQMMEIADKEFPSLWQEISEVLVRTAGHFGHEKKQEWQKAIDKFLKDPLTQKDEINVDELKRWYENDIEVKKALGELKDATQEGMAHLETALGHKVETTELKLREHFQTVVEMAQEDIKDQLRKMQQAMVSFNLTATDATTATSTTKCKDDSTKNGGQEDQHCFPNANKTPPAGHSFNSYNRENLPPQDQGSGDVSKYEELEIIKDTEDGPPYIRKLQVKEELSLSKSMLSRKSIGEIRQSPEKVLLMVGAAGAGKSTLINAMANYLKGVKWDDDFRFKLITNDEPTSYLTAYTFYPAIDESPVPYTFTVIDSPGFGGTDGLRRDKEITEQIKKFFTIPLPEGIDHLDGVGFVIDASQARLTPTQKYIFDSILSIFGCDVPRNIFTMITFADSQTPPVLDVIKETEIPSQNEKLFKFNNSALFASNVAQEGIIYDKKFWEMNKSSLDRFFLEFPKSECISLHLTKKVLKEREQLYVSLESLKDQIKLGLDKMEEMRQEELVLQAHELEIEANKDFTFKVTVTKPVHVSLEGTGQHTTTCIKCQSTCHKNCKIADETKKFNCSAMGEGGKCRICPLGCIWSDHKNFPYFIKYEVSTETGTLESLKKKYLKAVHGKATAKQMLISLAESLENVHVGVLNKIRQAQKSVRRLNEIALKPKLLTEAEYIELLIESEKRAASPGWAQRVKYYEVAKRHAQLLSKTKDEDESEKLVRRLSRQVSDISEEARKTLENLSLDDDDSNAWYSRFKF